MNWNWRTCLRDTYPRASNCLSSHQKLEMVLSPVWQVLNIDLLASYQWLHLTTYRSRNIYIAEIRRILDINQLLQRPCQPLSQFLQWTLCSKITRHSQIWTNRIQTKIMTQAFRSLHPRELVEASYLQNNRFCTWVQKRWIKMLFLSRQKKISTQLSNQWKTRMNKNRNKRRVATHTLPIKKHLKSIWVV